MVSKKRSRISQTIFFFLNDIGDKFNALALKRLVDYLFILSEKIIIHFPRFIKFYINYYDDIIDHEINIADISATSKTVHIGCGPIPSSSILLAQKTKGYVLGIDRDNHAVDHAKTLIAELSLSKHVDIKKAGALDTDFSSFDVILISQGIFPKEQILQQLSTNLTNNQIIILRSFSPNKQLDEQDQFLSDYYSIHQIYHHNIHGSTISIFLKKKQK